MIVSGKKIRDSVEKYGWWYKRPWGDSFYYRTDQPVLTESNGTNKALPVETIPSVICKCGSGMFIVPGDSDALDDYYPASNLLKCAQCGARR